MYTQKRCIWLERVYYITSSRPVTNDSSVSRSHENKCRLEQAFDSLDICELKLKNKLWPAALIMVLDLTF